MRFSCPVARWARAEPNRLAMKAAGRAWTFAELDDEIARFASALAARGVAPGSRVAVLSFNRPEGVASFFAAWRLGACIAPLNARLTPAELAPQLQLLGPALALAEAALSDRAPGSIPLEELAGEARRAKPSAAAAGREADLIHAILFTSGTTGRSRAAALTWENFEASARASAANLGQSPDEVWLACLPFFHVGGVAMVTRCALQGSSLVVHPRFDAAAASEAIDSEGVTHASLVATGLNRVVLLRGERRFPARLRALLIGGGPVPAELLARARALGAPVLQTYGLSEACSQVTTERPSEADGQTAGPPLPGLSVRIVAPDGSALPQGEVGEIEVLGPTVMKGYFRDESETHQTLWKGWLRTRDLGSLDERGRLRVLARRSDLILTGGENVYPAEVEALLLSLPGVEDAAVVGVEDPEWGQVPVAAVVLSGAAAGALASRCRERLAGFKVPRRFVSLPELPRNAGGKVDRLRIRALLADGNPGDKQPGGHGVR